MDEKFAQNANAEGAEIPQVKMQSMKTRRRQQIIFIIAMLFIPIAHWFIWAGVSLSAISLAFQNNYREFTLENFVEVKKLFTDSNTSLSISLWNTVKTFFFSEAVGVPITLTVSYFMYKQIKGYKTLRVIFYLPHIISGIVLVTAFKQLVSVKGPIVSLLDNWGVDRPRNGFLHTPGLATNWIIFFMLWKGACGNILFYSAMGRIPPELIEVGRLEGLQLFKELIYVIMPLIWPTFSTTVILDLCGILSAGGPVLLFGGDVISSGKASTISYWFFSKVYGGGAGGIGSYGVMSAVGLVFTAISVPITLTIRHLLDKVDTGEF